jgi:hypothetical protein
MAANEGHTAAATWRPDGAVRPPRLSGTVQQKSHTLAKLPGGNTLGTDRRGETP